MKIEIENFGPISKFTYDLSKDIVVTFGDNNIGKSYAMQLVYLLLKNLSDYSAFRVTNFSYHSRIYYDSCEKDIRKAVDNFIKSEKRSENISSSLNSAILTDLSEKFLTQFLHSCLNTFGNFNVIQEKEPTIDISFRNYNLSICLGEILSITGTIYSYPTYIKRSPSNFHKSRNANGRLDIYYSNDIDSTFSRTLEELYDALTSFATDVLNTVGNVYFLPASRSGIYSGMSAFSSIIAELSKSKAMLTRKIELPGISEPISDYFLQLSNIRYRDNSKFLPVYQEIESNILHGKVSFNKKQNTLVYIPNGMEHEFEMTEVSSMVSEISPIVAFMKYIIGRNNRFYRDNQAKPILFIEEPEAHLHPQNQVRLVELFTQLHSLGVKLVISSHSNYIFNKLNNLLLGGKITPSIYSAILLQSTESGSISTFMEIDDLGVSDTNFMDTAQELYNERESLISAWTE